MSASHAERRDWLRLSLSENVGPVTFAKLIARFGTAKDAIAALPDLARNGGYRRPIRLYGEREAEADLDRAAELGITPILKIEAAYPSLLRHVETAPAVLWTKGRTEIAQQACVAIVGARNASLVGLKFARKVSGEIAAAGFPVISGLARGIDTAAHQAALPHATIAVLAGGIDHIYPPENAALHDAIADKGLIVSEMKPGTVPKAEHFPRRNRIISGMARATAVIEAALRSGSLITARLAAEQGREVFAVPGSPLDPRSEGTNRLIREGATLMTSAADVIEAMGGIFMPMDTPLSDMGIREEPRTNVSDSDRQRILELLSPAPVEIDDLIRECGLPSPIVSGIVLELELAGRIARHAGGSISLLE